MTNRKKNKKKANVMVDGLGFAAKRPLAPDGNILRTIHGLCDDDLEKSLEFAGKKGITTESLKVVRKLFMPDWRERKFIPDKSQKLMMIAEWMDGEKPAEIAKRYNVDTDYVTRIVRRATGFSAKGRFTKTTDGFQCWNKKRIEAMVAMRASGKSLVETARELNISTSAAYSAWHRWRVQNNKETGHKKEMEK